MANSEWEILCLLSDTHAALEQVEFGKYAGSDKLFIKAHQSGSILHANSAWERLLGWSQMELSGKNWMLMVHPGDLGQLTSFILLLRSAHLPPPGIEMRMSCKDSHFIRVRWSAARWSRSGVTFALGEVLSDT